LLEGEDLKTTVSDAFFRAYTHDHVVARRRASSLGNGIGVERGRLGMRWHAFFAADALCWNLVLALSRPLALAPLLGLPACLLDRGPGGLVELEHLQCLVLGIDDRDRRKVAIAFGGGILLDALSHAVEPQPVGAETPVFDQGLPSVNGMEDESRHARQLGSPLAAVLAAEIAALLRMDALEMRRSVDSGIMACSHRKSASPTATYMLPDSDFPRGL